MADLIEQNDDGILMKMNVTCAGSGEKEEFTICFKHDDKYDPNYESDKIKFIKSTGLIDPDHFKFHNGYIFCQSGSFFIDTPEDRDNAYEYAYVTNRDKITISNLKKDDQIEFGENGIEYDNMAADLDLLDDDIIVLDCSYAKILFTYPVHDPVMFTIRSKNKIRGFTKRDLANKIMIHFKMMYLVSTHYNSSTVSLQVEEIDWLDRKMFRSVMDWEYVRNSIMAVVYNGNEWDVMFGQYI
jgi:hypothetical protein